MLAPRLSARFGLYRATLVGLGLAVVGGIALLLAVLVARNSLLPFFVTASIFLFGLGIASPLSSAAALSPFGDKAGAAAALFGFSQMAGAACGASLAAVLDSDPAIGLGAVLALTSLLALVLHGWKRRLGVIAVDFFTATAPVVPPHLLSQDEVRDILRSCDAAQTSP